MKKPPADQKKPRKKRAAQHNHGRRREAPTCIRLQAILPPSRLDRMATSGLQPEVRTGSVRSEPSPRAARSTSSAIYSLPLSAFLIRTERKTALDKLQEGIERLGMVGSFQVFA
ncbi:MAG TPA: hypothetical protein VJ761_21975 [Ktedonobacteraceae bacterium]|nr:hypothetical protein [Ktedonobacteraceae bacterium]